MFASTHCLIWNRYLSVGISWGFGVKSIAGVATNSGMAINFAVHVPLQRAPSHFAIQRLSVYSLPFFSLPLDRGYSSETIEIDGPRTTDP